MKHNPEVDAYIAAYPPKVRALMKTIRATIHKALPDGEERLSYGMAGYFRDGAVAYFSAFKNHIGFFPPTTDPKLKKAAAKYAGARGNLKFSAEHAAALRADRKARQSPGGGERDEGGREKRREEGPR